MRKSNSRIIVLTIAFVLLVAVCWKIVNIANRMENTSDSVSYLNNALRDKYGVEFVYISEMTGFTSNASSQNPELNEYYFYPLIDPNLIVTATCGYSTDSGMINTVIPFERHRWFQDNLAESVKKNIIESNYSSVINLAEVSVEEATETIYSLMLDVQKELKKYNVSTSKFSCDIFIDIYSGDRQENIHFYALDKDIIRDCIIKNYN